MKIQRGVFCRLLFSLLADHVTSLEIDATGLKSLQTGKTHQPGHRPFEEMGGLAQVRGRLFHSAIDIPLINGKTMRFGGVGARQARAFVHALNEAWVNAWQQKLAPHVDAIRSLSNALERLENPQNFPAACRVAPLWVKAEALVRSQPVAWPEGALAPQIRASIDQITLFHALPDYFRDRAVDRFMAKEQAAMARFFETIEKNPLTEQQRRAVVCDEDATLVLAGAGSGKTSVITAKAAYLIHRGLRKPPQILMLAFGKDAAKEMSERIRQCCQAEVPALTFHKLAYDIIAEVEGRRPPLAAQATDDKALQSLLRQILQELAARDEQIGTGLLRWFTEFLVPARSQWDFTSQHAYFSYVKRHELRTLQGERVRSFEELQIANWLCLNGIAYEYEPPYAHELPATGRKRYTPDFRLTESGVYIEHFGVRWKKDKRGQKHFSTAPCIDRDQYLEGMAWKRAVHAQYGTTLVETYSQEHTEGRLLPSLKKKLAPYVELKPIPLREALSRLGVMGQFDDFTSTLGTFLRHFKGSGATMEQCRRKAMKHMDQRRNLAFMAIFKPVYVEYHKRLGAHIDFDDMISRATDHVRKQRYHSPYRHLLVDEFQDLSRGRADLLLALKRQHRDTRLFAVGDDWQSIYRFSGSDIHLMRHFGPLFGGLFARHHGIHRTIDLGRTFRSVDRIASPARRFIVQNPAQINKEVMPAGTADAPAIEVLWSTKHRGDETLHRALSHLVKRSAGRPAAVLLVGRYNWQRPTDLPHLNNRYPGLSIAFKSIHASKGLEADHVIILGADSGRHGLPSEVVDDPLLDLVLPRSEPFEHAEERRVFYVALTRARHSVTIIAREDRPSVFVNELLENAVYGVTESGRGSRRRHR